MTNRDQDFMNGHRTVTYLFSLLRLIAKGHQPRERLKEVFYLVNQPQVILETYKFLDHAIRQPETMVPADRFSCGRCGWVTDVRRQPVGGKIGLADVDQMVEGLHDHVWDQERLR